MKLCVAQPIFAPNKEMFDKNIRSIRSLKNLQADNVDFYFSGYALDEYWNELDTEIDKLCPVLYNKYSINYGKAYNINSITSNLTGYDLLLTMDSDIVFLDDYDYLGRINDLNIENLGVISFMQLEGNCHLVDRLDQKIVINNHTFIYNRDGGGIAGGCVLVNFDFWKEIGGYRVMGVYAGDDAFLFIDAMQRGKRFALDLDIEVIHPFENDHEYQKWKVSVCQRDSNGIERDISNQIEEATNFWRERKN